MRLPVRLMTLALFARTGGYDCERCGRLIRPGDRYVRYAKYAEAMHEVCYRELTAAR